MSGSLTGGGDFQGLVDLDVLPTGELQQRQTLVSGVWTDGGDPQVGDRLGGICYKNTVLDLFCHVSWRECRAYS